MCRQNEEDVRVEPVTGSAESGSRGPGLTRRRALLAGTGAGIALAALDAVPAAASTGPQPGPAPRLEVSFDEGWRFFRGDVAAAQAPGFDDSRWRELDVPHDWRIEDLPDATSDDGGASANPSAFAFNANPSPDGSPPQVIGPFDANADPVPDNIVNYGGNWVSPGGRSQGYTVAGTGWYRKHFTVPDLPGGGARGWGDGQRAELRFDGVYGRADVWLNGVHLGFHPNGYTSFAYDLTPHLNPGGENVLAVRVDNTGKTSRWYTGSGIYRHTWLTVTGPVRIPLWGTYVTTPVADKRQSVAHVEVQVANFGAAAAPASVRMTVLDPGGRLVVTQTAPAQAVNTGETQTYAADLVITGAALWSPEDPSLYQVGAEVLLDGKVVDDVRTTFGIRSLEWNGTDGFVLNGEQVKLLAGCIHHDHGPLGAMALDRSVERVIETLKAAGFNAIRASHNPRAPYMLEACDRLGMLVWDEFSDVWDVGKLPDDYSNYFPQYWQQDLTSMILRDRNHASVIIWSLGNEIPSDANNYGPRLKALVQSLDTTRAITVGGTPFSAPYDDVLDVHYGNWDSQQYGTDSEDSVFSTHASDSAKAVTQSESFAATIYDDTELAAANSWFAGNFVWTAWDYIGETGISAPAFGANYADAATYQLGATFGVIPYPWYSSFSGDFDLIGQRKPQNHWRSVVYGRSTVEMMVERPAPPGTEEIALLFGYYDELESWTWDVPQGQSMTVHIYTSGDNVTLLLNGTQIAAQSLTAADRMIATVTVPYAPGELTAIAARNGTEIGRKMLTTTGAPAALRLSSDVESLTTARDDLAHVLVEVVDAHGRRVPDAVVKVGFAISGAGQLAGVGNGNPHNADSFQRPRRWTWHGQALAVLRPAKTPGSLTLTAAAQGLKSASIILPVSAANKAPQSPAAAGKPRVAASLAGPGLALGLGAAVLKRRMRNTRPATAGPGDITPGGDSPA